jgi:hypothetical protein
MSTALLFPPPPPLVLITAKALSPGGVARAAIGSGLPYEGLSATGLSSRAFSGSGIFFDAGTGDSQVQKQPGRPC